MRTLKYANIKMLIIQIQGKSQNPMNGSVKMFIGLMNCADRIRKISLCIGYFIYLFICLSIYHLLDLYPTFCTGM